MHIYKYIYNICANIYIEREERWIDGRTEIERKNMVVLMDLFAGPMWRKGRERE
jgi:hypothetical protein